MLREATTAISEDFSEYSKEEDMAGILWIIILMLIIAVIIIAVSIITYNKHLDKVTKGEVHDTHSSIPEPRSTASVIYKIILMVVVVLSYLGISTLNGMIGSMQTRIGQLDAEVNGLNYQIENLKTELENRDKLVSSFEYEISDPKDGIVDVSMDVYLREFTEDTTVSLSVAGHEANLEKASDGHYKGTVSVGLFEDCSYPHIYITQDGRTTGEDFDFPQELFWDYIPYPCLDCRFDLTERPGKDKYTGEYTMQMDRLSNLESITVTYISQGKELLTKDITEETFNHETITLEEGLDIENELMFRFEILTKDGYRYEELKFMIFQAKEYPVGTEYERVYDSAGNMVYEYLF